MDIDWLLYTVYSMDNKTGDTTFSDFDIDAAPAYLFSTIADILVRKIVGSGRKMEWLI